MAGLDEGLSLDRLSSTLQILQHRRGHRATSDDVILAGIAAAARPDANRVLDLGTGKGTVGLLLCSALPACTVVGIEAEPASHALALKNVALNRLEARFEPRLGDLREAPIEATYDLVCGAPPFMPVGSGVLPQHPLRAAGRFELRGGIEDYAKAVDRALAAGGRGVLLMDGLSDTRAREALRCAGLKVLEEQRISPRPGRPPTYRVYTCARRGEEGEARLWSMRGATGPDWSATYAALRARLQV